jgi:predicted kinase
MLVGLPGSGKSTWLAAHAESDARILSTDDYIEQCAARLGLTYSEAFAELIQPAEQHLAAELAEAVRLGQTIYWDQTNVTVKSRKKKLKKIPSHYGKHAIYFDVPLHLIAERLAIREQETGKHIPQAVIRNLAGILVPPSETEGFESVRTIS